MREYRRTKVSDLPIKRGSYIYSIRSNAERDDLRYDSRRPLQKLDTLAAISSDNALLIMNPETLSVIPDGHIKNVSSSVTTLVTMNSLSMLVAGRDGCITMWSPKYGPSKEMMKFEVPGGPSSPISALACHEISTYIAAGTELEGNGPGDVKIFVFDQRWPKEVLRTYSESHTDTVTELRFLPWPDAMGKILLSGSTDGLVNIFNIDEAEEDDAVLQVINVRSAVHHAGLIGDEVYALGTDEKLSFHCAQPSITHREPDPVLLGDIREGLSCEYAIKIWNDSTPLLGVGNHSEHPDLRLVPFVRKPREESPSPNWIPDLENSIHLTGGHGEEVIRDFYVDSGSKTIFTCGEDGAIRQWRDNAIEDVEMEEPTPVKRKHLDSSDGSEKKKKKA
jgi:WD repeat-containing protein 89